MWPNNSASCKKTGTGPANTLIFTIPIPVTAMPIFHIYPMEPKQNFFMECMAGQETQLPRPFPLSHLIHAHLPFVCATAQTKKSESPLR